MAIKKYKPTSPGRRGMTAAQRTSSTKNAPHKPLVRKMKKSGGDVSPEPLPGWQ